MLAEPESDTGDLFDSGGNPLSDLTAEMQLLGALLTRPDQIALARNILGGDMFFDPWHRRMFEAMERAYDHGEVIGAQTMIDALGGDGKAVLLNGVTVGHYIAKLAADASDDLDVELTAEQIAVVAERRAIGAADDVYQPFISRFGGLRWSEIGAPGSPQYEWIVENLIPKGEPVLIFGDSGTGKSFSTFDMAVHIARGRKFYGHNVDLGLVVYVAAEGGKGFSKRKVAYVAYHNLDDVELPFFLLTKRPDFFSSETDTDALINEIKAICKLYKVPLVLIVLDTLSASTPGMNENASADVSRVRQRLQRLVDAFGVATAFVHHTAKGGTTPRGHGSLTADFETTIQFRTTNIKSADGLPVHEAVASKEREAKKGDGWKFTLPVVSVGRNKWGNEETSCVAVPYDGNTQRFAYGFQATNTEMTFMQALFEALDDHGVPPPAGLPQSITKAVDLQFVREAMRTRYISTEEDTTKAANRFRQAFKRAADALKAAGVVGYRTPLIWWSGKSVKGLTTSLSSNEKDEA